MKRLMEARRRLGTIGSDRLLFIEPSQAASTTPVIDDITRKMSAALRKAKSSDYAYFGIHECMCGAHSTARDYHLPNGDVTNSLCVHYVAHHRSEVPPEQLVRISAFVEEDQPNEQELQGPEVVLEHIRAYIDGALGSDALGVWVAWGLDAEALCLSLRGGQLPKMAGYTEARRDAAALLSLLRTTKKALPRLQELVHRSHGDVRSWGAEALRVPGWSRRAWAIPLADLMRVSDEHSADRRSIAMSFRLLGSHTGAAVPTLLELAKGATGDLRYDVGLALGDIQKTPALVVPSAAVPGLFELAQDPTSDPQLQISAALVLARAGLNTEHAVRGLLRMALAEARRFEYAAAVLCGTLNHTLGYVGEPGIEGWGRVALPLLLEALQASDWQVRARAIKLIGRLGRDAEGAVPALKKAEEDPKLRSYVEETLLRVMCPESAEGVIVERAAEKAKARVVVPPIDPTKPRYSQFFRFTCPFCFHTDVVSLWYTLKTCSNCQKHIHIVKQPGCSACELIDSPGESPNPPQRK